MLNSLIFVIYHPISLGKVHHTMLPLSSNPNTSLPTLNPNNLIPETSPGAPWASCEGETIVDKWSVINFVYFQKDVLYCCVCDFHSQSFPKYSTYSKQVRWKIKSSFDGIFTQNYWNWTTTVKTRSHPEMVGDMSRVTLNFDLSKIPFVHL